MFHHSPTRHDLDAWAAEGYEPRSYTVPPTKERPERWDPELGCWTAACADCALPVEMHHVDGILEPVDGHRDGDEYACALCVRVREMDGAA